MIDAFANSVLPVFAMVGLGAMLRYFGVFSVDEATVLSRFVYFVAGPVLIFRLIATADKSIFDWSLVGGYLIAEIFLYVGGYLLFRHIFKRGVRESILLGFCGVFANHLLYLLPIATYEFGEAKAAAIVTYITGDLVVLYAATLMLLDATDESGAGVSVGRVAKRMATNPQLIALFAGLAANFIGIPFGGGVATFALFLSGAASPVSLFSLGIVLASQKGLGDLRVSLSVTAIKLIAMPALVATVILVGFSVEAERAALPLLIASAPSGVMIFVMAIRYEIPAVDIGRAALISTLLSTFTVALMLNVI